MDMGAGKWEIAGRLTRVAACMLMLAAGAIATGGHAFGRWPRLTAGISAPSAAALAVLLAAALVPLFTKSRRCRTALLVLDVAVLGVWSGQFLSTARLVGWAGAGLPNAPADMAAALLMLAMAFLYPVFGRPSHYCLNACPFGAAQELAGRLPVRKWRLTPAALRRLAEFRRWLWAALMLSLWCGAWGRWMGWELFVAFAWRAMPPLIVALAVAAVALSAFVPRAYCRFVCPTGTLFKITESRD